MNCKFLDIYIFPNYAVKFNYIFLKRPFNSDPNKLIRNRNNGIWFLNPSKRIHAEKKTSNRCQSKRRSQGPDQAIIYYHLVKGSQNKDICVVGPLHTPLPMHPELSGRLKLYLNMPPKKFFFAQWSPSNPCPWIYLYYYLLIKTLYPTCIYHKGCQKERFEKIVIS